MVESYGVMRASLECALYAHLISTNDSRARVWLAAGTSKDASRRQVKSMFTARAVKDAVARRNPSLGAEIERLYAETINYGGHPNVDGHIAAAKWNAGLVIAQDMIPGTPQWRVAVRHCREIGVCDLHIFELMLADRFRDLGLSAKLDTFCQKVDRMRAGEE